jgi:hypothetical protein
MRRRLARLLLAIAVALAGPGAYAHALIHVGEALEGLHQHEDAGDEQRERYGCALDAAFAGADALGSRFDQPVLPVAGNLAPAQRRADRAPPCEALARFATRAPPVSR